MSFPKPLYRPTPEARAREVPEMEFCLVYLPSRAEIYRLNPSAWFVFRMCENRTEGHIARAYHAAMKPAMSLEESAAEVRAGIERLLKWGIVEEVRSRPIRSHEPRRIHDAHET